MNATSLRMEVQAALDKADIPAQGLTPLTALQVQTFSEAWVRIRRIALLEATCEHPPEVRVGRMCALCDRKVGTVQETAVAVADSMER